MDNDLYIEVMSREIFSYIIVGIFTCMFIAVCGCTLNSGVSSTAAIDAANATADRILNSINSGNYNDYSSNIIARLVKDM